MSPQFLLILRIHKPQKCQYLIQLNHTNVLSEYVRSTHTRIFHSESTSCGFTGRDVFVKGGFNTELVFQQVNVNHS